MTHDVTVTHEARTSTERTYDPLWSNALALLNYLSTHDLIQRDLWSARIGQFALVSGALVLLDMAMLKAAWEKPSIKKKIMEGAVQEQPTTQNRNARRQATSAQNTAREGAQFFLDLLSIMPHSLQAHLIGEDFRVWCSLAEESLAGISSDLVLKHGALLQGEWYVLGILDALPIGGGNTAAPSDDEIAAVMGSPVGTFAAQLEPITRNMVGRPPLSFGMTPLLVFRQVSG